MTTERVHIEEWHFGDEGWNFEVGAHLRLPCDLLHPEQVANLLELWDSEILRGVRYTLADGLVENTRVLAGVITRIQALECRYPSPTGGRAIAHSGTAQDVSHARGWTGDVDCSTGIVMAFLIDLEQDA